MPHTKKIRIVIDSSMPPACTFLVRSGVDGVDAVVEDHECRSGECRFASVSIWVSIGVILRFCCVRMIISIKKDGASGTQMSPELFRTSPLPTEVWAHILAEARAAQLRDALAFIDSFRFTRV